MEDAATWKKAGEMGVGGRWIEKYAGLSPCVHSYLKPPLMLTYIGFPNIRGHQTMETLLVVTTGWGATSIEWVQVRDAGKYPIMHRMAPQEKE